MAAPEKTFLKWFGSILAGFIVLVAFQSFNDMGSVDVMKTNINHNAQAIIDGKAEHKEEIKEVKNMHEKDLNLIRGAFDDFRAVQSEIRKDIKELLRK